MESDLAAQVNENQQLLSERKKVERERDGFLEDFSTQKRTAVEEKKRMQARINSLERELGEEQGSYEACSDKLRKTQTQVTHF